MIVLSVNAGSSSLKFQAYDMPEENGLISGVFERIGMKESFYTIKINENQRNSILKLFKMNSGLNFYPKMKYLHSSNTLPLISSVKWR